MTSSRRVITARELNRSILARQLLLERSDRSVMEALEQVAGLQTQYAPTGYIGLWTRLRDFRREQLDRALEERRVVQGTLMRSTIHIVSARDYPLFAAGSRPARQAWWQRIRRADLEGLDMEAVARRVRELLAERPRRHREMLDSLAAEGYPPIAWHGAGQWLDLVRVPPSGTWARRRADLYALADDWLDLSQPLSEKEGLRHLALRYLGGFGPASPADIASWAGLPVSAYREVLADLDLRRYRTETGGELLDLPEATIPDPAVVAPPRFLGTWEAVLLVHARRGLIVAEEDRPRVFSTKNPQSVPTFLVDGRVAGTWKYVDGRVEIEPFGRLAGDDRAAVENEAEALGWFHE